MTKKTVVELNKVQSVYFGGGHIHSVRVPANGLENGNVVKLGANEATEYEVRAATTATKNDKVVLIANPAIGYDESTKGSTLESNYAMEQGEVVRAYDLTIGDEISVSEEGFTTKPTAVGDIVVASGYKLTKDTAAGTGTAFEVIGFVTKGGMLSLNVTHSPTKLIKLRVTQ